MTQVLSIEPGRRGTSVARVELTSGDVILIGFSSLMPLQMSEVYSKALTSILDRFTAEDQTDIFNYLSHELVRARMAMPLYVMPDRDDERTRIGSDIKALRESRNMEAKMLAQLTDIDAANLCRIEQGKYSAGLDILCKIAMALDARIEIVPNKQSDTKVYKQSWILPHNSATYDAASAVVETGYCIWRQYNTFSIGDYIYMYETKPTQRVLMKFVVSDVDLPYSSDTEVHHKYWHDEERYQDGISRNRYAKLKFCGYNYSESLSLEDLMAKGILNGVPQGAVKISPESAQKIDQYFNTSIDNKQ